MVVVRMGGHNRRKARHACSLKRLFDSRLVWCDLEKCFLESRSGEETVRHDGSFAIVEKYGRDAKKFGLKLGTRRP
jgi:hypothetical protein